MRRALWGVGTTLAMMVLVWIGGVDFDHRGVDTAYWLGFSAVMGIYVGWCVHSENRDG
jgi:hypothetical protein